MTSNEESEVTEEHEIKFHICCDNKDSVLCIGKMNESVTDAIKRNHLVTLPGHIDHFVFCGFVKGHAEEVYFNPTLLLCGFLEENSTMRTRKLPKSQQLLINSAEEIASDSGSNQIVFFLQTKKIPYAREIARVKRQYYTSQNICVSASIEDTFLKALEKDGRFLEPSRWILKQPNRESQISIDLTPRSFTNKVFTVELDNAKRKGSSDLSGKSDAPTSAKAPNIKKEKQPSLSSPPSHTLPNSIHSTSYSMDDFSGTKIFEAAKLSAEVLVTLIQSSEENRPNSLARLVEQTHSKVVDQSKSAWLMEKIVSASRSVGCIYLQNGYSTGTCFLVLENVILTNYHVYDDIKKEINKRQLLNPKVLVAFNYLLPNQPSSERGEVEVNIDTIVVRCLDEYRDYIFLELKSPCNDLQELSAKLAVDQLRELHGEVVTIVGHPDGREKFIDTDCRVIHEHLWRPDLHDRQQRRNPFFYNPLFSCKREIMSDKYKDKIAYDTSFAHGASGSPVFNDEGNIVAMHVCGWVLSEPNGKSFSVMEFAIPMQAIYEDCKQQNSDIADILFSRLMDVDE